MEEKLSGALARRQHADERLDLAEKKQASLLKATNHALLLFRNGMATYLEVITAQNNSLQNQLETIADLYRALGGGSEN